MLTIATHSRITAMRPRSCDTFVALPPATPPGRIVFAKNSDRPTDEAQHVVFCPPHRYSPGSSLRCTYITIPQASNTHAVVLSKPRWMWGAEMAANSEGLVVGNEAVWTKEPENSSNDALLGMDLVRLAAERCATAEAAVALIAELLETHGQGGACEEGGNWTYHNSFLIADRNEAWVLETAGRWWAAERVISGVRNISNCLSIRTKIDRSSEGLQEHAREAGYWDGSGEFDWAAAFSEGYVPPRGQKNGGREAAGLRLLEKATKKASSESTKGSIGVDVKDMMSILRDVGSGICMCGDGGFRSNGSQVSELCRDQQLLGDVHYFTGTPDPSRSCFKPFIFPSLSAENDDIDAGDDESTAGDGQGGIIEAAASELYYAAEAAQRGGPRHWEVTYKDLLLQLEEEGLRPYCDANRRHARKATYTDFVQRELRIYLGSFRG
jgi:secernin